MQQLKDYKLVVLHAWAVRSMDYAGQIFALDS